jgi:hypothetical protein
VRHRAGMYYQQFDALAILRQELRRDLLAESRNDSARKWLRQIPSNRTHSGASPARSGSNTTSPSHQTATLGLRRVWNRDAQQRRSPLGGWAVAPVEEAKETTSAPPYRNELSFPFS